MKLCIDCKWHDDGDCFRLITYKVSPVNGKNYKTRMARSCSWERRGGQFISFLDRRCSISGKYWEKKTDIAT